MLVGDALRSEAAPIEQLERRFDDLFGGALLRTLLLELLGISSRRSTLQRLSATFRRGVLLEELPLLERQAETIAEEVRSLRVMRSLEQVVAGSGGGARRPQKQDR